MPSCSLARHRVIRAPPETTYRDFVALERAAIESDEQRAFWGAEAPELHQHHVSAPRTRRRDVERDDSARDVARSWRGAREPRGGLAIALAFP